MMLVEVPGGHLLRPKLEGNAEDLVPLVLHQRGGDRRIDAAAHRDGDLH